MKTDSQLSDGIKRCLNLDWFEVYLLESIQHFPMDTKFFESRGWEVKKREYGTPQYREKFTLYQGGFPLYEISRDPYSTKEQGGIFEKNACHLRVCNRTLYEKDCIKHLREFLLSYDYIFKGITRADVCLDFVTFDNMMKPQTLINNWNKGLFRKINACNSHEHGVDRWSAKEINSVKWGSEQSMISTKLYNKTMELSRVSHDKFYIRDAWKAAGIPDDSEVWRIEFSIKGNCKKWIRVSDPQVEKGGKEQNLNEFLKENKGKIEFLELQNIISTYESKERLNVLFFSLASKYFHWKKQTLTKDGNKQRKDRCEDVNLFKYGGEIFKPEPLTLDREPGRTERLLIKHCKEINENHLGIYSENECCAAGEVIKALSEKKRLKTFCEREGIEFDLIKTREDFEQVMRMTRETINFENQKERNRFLINKYNKQINYLQEQIAALSMENAVQ